MTKDEAISHMQQGKKITHYLFEIDEWMTMNSDGNIVLEDGVECSLSEFFKYRSGECWNDNYAYFN